MGGKNPTLATLAVGASSQFLKGAYKILKDLAAVINAKKYLKGEAVQSVVNINGPVILVQGGDDRFELTREQLELLKSKAVDPDLDKLTSPLREGQVDQLELKTSREVLCTVKASDRPFFTVDRQTPTASEGKMWLEGTLNSLSKDRNRGTFHTVAGKHLAYRYSGTNQSNLLNAFAHEGLVRVHGNVTLDPNSQPTSIDIDDVQLAQSGLNFEN